MRWGGASERVSVLVAIGVTEEGFREVLACGAGFRESEESWRAFSGASPSAVSRAYGG